MKIRKLLSVIVSTVMIITSLSLTAFFTSADESASLNYNCNWQFVHNLGSFNVSQVPCGLYFYIDNYDTYKRYESKANESEKILSGYDKSFFDENMLLVNYLTDFNGDPVAYEDPEIIKNQDGTLTFNYIYDMSFEGSPWIVYDANIIEFKKSEVANIDFSDITVNVTKTYSRAEQMLDPDGEPLNPDPSTIPDENITIDMIFSPDYTSSISTKYLFKSIYHSGIKNCYFIIDNYKDYTACGFKEKSEEYFNDYMLLVNCIYNSECACDVYTNESIVKSADNTLTISYNALWEYPRSETVEYATDIIELKKADVKNVDFSKLSVGVTNNYTSIDTNIDLPLSNYVELDMKYIDISTVLANENIKPSNNSSTAPTTVPTTAISDDNTANAVKNAKVKKLNVKAKGSKKIVVTWKKLKKAKGYQVQVSAKKNFKNKIVNKKSVTKNKINISSKKLKSGKTYYVRVRAYAKVNGEKVCSKWSKKNIMIVKLK